MRLKPSESNRNGTEFQKRLRITLHDREAPLAWCDFSPGPWWGFNGIQTLVLTDQNLRVYQRGIAITARRDASQTAITIIPLTSIRTVITKSRRGLFGAGGAFTMKVAWIGGRKTFTTKYAEGADLARTLSQLSSGS